jgi:hypothetical protein
LSFDQRVRFDDALAADVKAFADAAHISVADAIRLLVSRGLAAEKPLNGGLAP